MTSRTKPPTKTRDLSVERECSDAVKFVTAPISKIISLRKRLQALPFYAGLQDGLLFAGLLFLGVAAALIVAEPWTPDGDVVPMVRIDETDIPTGEPRPASLIKLVRERLQTKVRLEGPGIVHETTWAALGATVDMPSLGELLVELGKSGSPTARYFASEGDGDAAPKIALPVLLGSNAAVESLTALKDIIDRPPEDATFDFKAERVTDEEPGLALDVYTTLSRLDDALGAGKNEIEMAVDSVPADITKAELKEIDVSAVIGFFETPFSRMRKDKDRTFNVKLGSSRLDGHIIMPGETFSFNNVLGERSEARGFRYAPVIAGGVLVEGMGGGTCQVASTLYSASFFAGLVVKDRHTHSRPSSYIKLGLDATVSYPDLDLKLKNPFDFPVAVHFTADNGILRAEIRGKRRPYTVTLLRRITGQSPFPVRVIEDSNVIKGKEVVTQNGIPGYTVRRYQVIETDKVGYRFQTVDKYPPTTKFVHKGTAESAADINPSKAPKPDNHKPYHASTYLRMVQGPDGLWYQQTHE